MSFVVESPAGAFLYVLGGTNSWKETFSDVQRARIASDGSLEAFEPAGKMDGPRAGHVVATVEGHVLVAGGSNQSVFVDTSAIADINPDDGSLSAFRPGPKLPDAIMHGTAVVSGRTVYLFGGRGEGHAHGPDGGTAGDGTTSKPLAVRTTLQEDGSFSAFEPVTPLSPDRSHHMSFVYASWVYVAGGFSGSPLNGAHRDLGDVQRAPILPDGTLGAWEPAGMIEPALSVTNALLFNDHVYFFGGLSGTTFFKKVWRSRVSKEGMFGPLELLEPTLNTARGHVHTTPMYRGSAYAVGGQTGARSLDAVERIVFE